MYTIHFKNGKTKEVPEEIGHILKTRLLNECKQFQVFSYPTGILSLVINMQEVVFIDETTND